MADITALYVNADGSLSQLSDGDALLADIFNRKSSSGNLAVGGNVTGADEDIVIGASLAATGELQLGSVDALVHALGDADVDGDLTSERYFLGAPDLGLHPIANNQSVMVCWWSLQIAGHERGVIGPTYSPANVGNNDDWSVVIAPGSVAADVQRAILGVVSDNAAGAGADLQQWMDSGLNTAVSIDNNGNLSLFEEAELRFYDTGSSNYVGFEAPALTGDQIYVLPAADGSPNDVLYTNGSGTLGWTSAGSGDVTGPGTHADNVVPRFNGIDSNALQVSGLLINDDDDLIFPAATSAEIRWGVARCLTYSGTTLFVGQDTGADLVVTVDLEASTTVEASINGAVIIDVTAGGLSLYEAAELRFYDTGSSNYVGFEAPALTANQIWILPAVDSTGTQYLQSDGSGNLGWGTPAGGGDVNGPASSQDNIICRFSGTGGKTIQGGGADGVSDNPPSYDDSGNFYVDADGSSTGAPRILGAVDFSDTEAIQWQFGDSANSISNSYGGAMTIRSYHTMILRGNNSNLDTSWSTETGIGVWIDNTAAGDEALVIDRASGQTAALLQFRQSGGTLLSQFTNLGDLDLNGGNIEGADTITYDGVTAHGSMGTTETFDFSANRLHSATNSAACTITFTAPAGPCNVIIELTNGGAFGITWPGTVTWPDGTEPTWTTSGLDVVCFYYNGTNYRGGMSPDHS